VWARAEAAFGRAGALVCGASLFATIVIVPFDIRTDRLIEAHTHTHARTHAHGLAARHPHGP
jgi:hypothetical protein